MFVVETCNESNKIRAQFTVLEVIWVTCINDILIISRDGLVAPVFHYVHPTGGGGGGHIIFAFSGVRRPTWFPDVLGNSSYPIFTKFGMQVYWVNSLYGIAFGDDSSIAN